MLLLCTLSTPVAGIPGVLLHELPDAVVWDQASHIRKIFGYRDLERHFELGLLKTD